MTKMDEEIHPECDIYFEDERSGTLLKEILVKHSTDSVLRCRFIPYGSAQVGCSLGQMIIKKCFPRPSCIFLDGDQAAAPGCNLLPGDEAPERVVFSGLDRFDWQGVAMRIGRTHPNVVDSCRRSMTLNNHKEWLQQAAEKLLIGTDSLWEGLCYCWANSVLSPDDGKRVVKGVEECLTILARSYTAQQKLL
jgi:hypothetical protein